MLASKGFEGGETDGLDFIKAEVVKMSSNNVKLPHIGWNKVDFIDINPDNLRYNNFYFMHTYHMVPEDFSIVKATCNYGDNKIASIVMKDNVAGFQFHPEKSQGDGLRIIKYVIDKLVS
jgi:glutamine amidotransferase